MWPLRIVRSVMGGMRPASAAFEAIEAEVLLKISDVLHPRAVWGEWASEASLPPEASQ